jgi:hypothetical protein
MLTINMSFKKLKLYIIKKVLISDGLQFHQYQQNKQLPLNSVHQYQQNKQLPLNSDGQQFHQYQQNKQLPLNSDGQQFHQYQQNKQLPLNSDGMYLVSATPTKLLIEFL